MILTSKKIDNFHLNKISILFLIFSILTFPAVAESLTVYDGESVMVEGTNASIIWGQDYTFDASGLTIYEEGFQINMTGTTRNYNISVVSSKPETANVTLKQYDLSSNPEKSTNLLRLEADASSSSQVDFTFAGIPDISSDEYVLERNGTQINTFSSGGTVSWSHSNWDSSHQFTLAYGSVDEDISPTVTLTSPSSGETFTGGSQEIELSADFNDDIELNSATLYTSETGSWEQRDTFSISGTSASLVSTREFDPGTYKYNFKATDSTGQTRFSNVNRTFTVESENQDNDSNDTENTGSTGDSSTGGSTESSNEDSSGGYMPDINPDAQKFNVSKEKVAIRVEKGSSVQESIEVQNGENPSEISVYPNSINRFVSVTPENFELESSEEKTVNVNVEVSEDVAAGGYEGYIILESSTTKKSVPVAVIVKSKSDNVDITLTAQKTYDEDQPVSFDASVFNVGNSETIESTVTTQVLNSKDEVVYEQSHNIESLENFQVVPSDKFDLSEGSYTLKASVESGDEVKNTATTFQVSNKSGTMSNTSDIKAQIIVGILVSLVIIVSLIRFIGFFQDTEDTAEEETQNEIGDEVIQLKKRVENLEDRRERVESDLHNDVISEERYEKLVESIDQKEKDIIDRIDEIEENN